MTIKQDIKVSGVSSIEFLKTCQEVWERGARYKEGTYVALNTMPLMAEFVVEIDENNLDSEWKDNGPWIRAIPVSKAKFVYSKEELEELSWEDFKRVVKEATGATGRDRGVLSATYLKHMENSK